MNRTCNVAAQAAQAIALPETANCNDPLDHLNAGIAKIHAQIAAADLDRQASKRKIDPRWFYKAKMALHHLQRERAKILAAMPVTAPRKASLKDAIIAVLRERHDEAGWRTVLGEAHLRLDKEAR